MHILTQLSIPFLRTVYFIEHSGHTICFLYIQITPTMLHAHKFNLHQQALSTKKIYIFNNTTCHPCGYVVKFAVQARWEETALIVSLNV